MFKPLQTEQSRFVCAFDNDQRQAHLLIFILYIYHDFSSQIHCLVFIRLQDYTRRCFLYKLSGSSDTSTAMSSCISNVVPSRHTGTLMPLHFSASTVCMLYTMKWSSCSSGDSSLQAGRRLRGN
ncbi:hypothetical protein NP493_497g00015 [Ridgeia piscesae]|uniref:Uncharacterized protein n=1 Tax=Ridgeia piscesae TaxID=27915 RepID=A0AAD9KYM2_RIDPI|nr:hypothetical protein NP493_497g00015 [Ridgeia piscesae]